MKLLNKYFELQKQIYDYFEYEEDWVCIPLEDATEYYWYIGNCSIWGGDGVCFGETKEKLKKNPEQCYSNQIYTQRFLPKWVYRGEDYTMICVDTHVDGNKFLQIFDNKKEVPELGKEYTKTNSIYAALA